MIHEKKKKKRMPCWNCKTGVCKTGAQNRCQICFPQPQTRKTDLTPDFRQTMLIKYRRSTACGKQERTADQAKPQQKNSRRLRGGIYSRPHAGPN